MVLATRQPTHIIDQLCDFDRLRATLRRYSLDAVVCSVPHNVYYLSGYDHPPLWHFPFQAFAVVPQVGEPALVISGLGLAAPAELNLLIQDIYPYGQREVIIYDAQELLEVEQWLMDFKASLADKRSMTPFDAIARALRERGVASGAIGFDDPGIAHRIPIEGLRALDAVDVMREARMVKSPGEIKWMRKAAKVNEDATLEAAQLVPYAATWDDVVQRFKAEVVLRGGEPKYLLGGAQHHTSSFQHQFRDYPLHRGDLLMVDSLSTTGHYHGDFGRMISWGDPDKKALSRFNAMRRGLEAGLEASKPGVLFADVGKVIVDTVRREGFGQFFAATPHSVGLEHTDTPRIQGLRFEANMTLNFDIVYMEAGWGALHLEDTFLVTPNGNELLTSGKNEMIIVS